MADMSDLEKVLDPNSLLMQAFALDYQRAIDRLNRMTDREINEACISRVIVLPVVRIERYCD